MELGLLEQRDRRTPDLGTAATIVGSEVSSSGPSARPPDGAAASARASASPTSASQARVSTSALPSTYQ